MGRQRIRARKYIYICLAGLMLFASGGCAILGRVAERDEAREALRLGQKLLARDDYEGSLREQQKALSLSMGRPPADEALFHMGLIYAHSGNPKKDYRKAVGLFQSLTRDYPGSPLLEQAKIWIGVLEASERLAQTNEKLSEMLERLKKVDVEIEQKRREKGR
ncbi:MAG: tetratricopeptide repeat protein [Deltaproteobacteria bacterium]|nr:tetratricopeptide repeat protein [Deltaproteobacteria bacterium]